MPQELYVIAGPNGIGKTTSTFDLVPQNIPIINSDEITATIRHAGITNVNTQEYGNQEANRLMTEYLEQRVSFAIETNLADLDTWKFLMEAQKLGYAINLVYLSTDHLHLLNARIDQRVLAGEHYVRPDIVEARYRTSLHLLNYYFRMPDHIQLFDNSRSLQLVIEAKQGEISQLHSPLPAWVLNHLSSHLNPDSSIPEKKVIDLNSIADVRNKYQSLNKKDNGTGDITKE